MHPLEVVSLYREAGDKYSHKIEPKRKHHHDWDRKHDAANVRPASQTLSQQLPNFIIRPEKKVEGRGSWVEGRGGRGGRGGFRDIHI